MKKILTAIATLAMLGTATPAFAVPAGVSWDLNFFADANQPTPVAGFTSAYPGFQEDVEGSDGGVTRSPFESNSAGHLNFCPTCNYNSVEGTQTAGAGGGFATYNVAGTPTTVFSMMWGSPDAETDRNRLEFFSGVNGTGASVLVLQGADALAGLLSLLPASAGYEAGRGYVHLLVTGYTFASVVLRDKYDNAFEHAFKSANQVVEEVPLPAGLMLLLTALAGVGYMGRSRAKTA